jgi:NAD-dependent dihydropyrimidine dehydrogenase PreA subunit
MKYLKNVVTLRHNPDLCTGCGRCLEVCPHRVFRRSGEKVAIRDRDACMECGACRRNCPFGAIEVDEGVGCAAAILMSFFTGEEPTCG